MRALVAIVLLLVAVACTSPAPPNPTSSATPLPPATPTIDASGIEVGSMAVVRAGQLRQVADPNHPEDRAFETPVSAVGRILQPLGEAAHVLVVGGPTNPNGDIYWRVADDAFPGCCAPFGWVRAIDASGQPALAPFQPKCPNPSTAMTGNELVGLGVMEASTCFGAADFTLQGEVRCARPQVDEFVAITGPDWTNEQTLCDLDQAIALVGPTVTSVYDNEPEGSTFDQDLKLTAHFNDPSSVDCRWSPGNYGPLPVGDAPIDTAQFACRMSVYVTEATATQSAPTD